MCSAISMPCSIATKMERRTTQDGGPLEPRNVDFFKSTRTRPAGDTTFWCAASINWALQQCGFRTTKRALSGSFRNVDSSTDVATRKMIPDACTESPKPGDIVVFRSRDQENARYGHGHVALFGRKGKRHIRSRRQPANPRGAPRLFDELVRQRRPHVGYSTLSDRLMLSGPVKLSVSSINVDDESKNKIVRS
jgi:hypothetical protein